MGKLEDIIARNKNPKRFGERMTVGIGLGVFILFILIAMVCTDLGKRPDEAPRIDPTDKRVDDIRLGTPRPRATGSATK